MKKENKNLKNKEVPKEENTEPTLADGVPVAIPLTKIQKFKRFFKLTDSAYTVLEHLFYGLLVIQFLMLFLVATRPLNMPIIFLMMNIAMPFKPKYFKKDSWKSLYVIIPVIILGGLANLMLFGYDSIVINLTYVILVSVASIFIQLITVLLSKNKKEHLLNALVYFLTALFWVAYTILLMFVLN